MTDPTVRGEVEAALDGLVDRVARPRALAVRAEDRVALGRAVERVRSQWLGEADAVLTIALAGCSGAGKSTLINALAGAVIAEAGEQRPCTMRTKVYHHVDVPGGGLPEGLAAEALFVAHDRPELRAKVIVDTPDLDTFATRNRAATKALLKSAGLVLYVFSPERYAEERAWSVIREEQRFSTCLAVLNKADTAPPAVLEKIADEIRQRFEALGKPEIKLLRVCAAWHVPGVDGRPEIPATAPGVLDEFATLRIYIEHELQAGDIARMVRQQRARVVDHLRDVLERIAVRDAIGALDRLDAAATERARELGQELADVLAARLAAVESDLAPLVTMRRHQRFWGPFRIWLSVADFLGYGLPRLVRRLRYGASYEAGIGIEAILTTGQAQRVEDLLRGEAGTLQDVCFANGLPVDRWRSITVEPRGGPLLAEVARQVSAQFEAAATVAFGSHRFLVTAVSLIGALMPAALVVLGLFVLLRNLTRGQLTGAFDLLGVVLVPTVLLYGVLHGLVALVPSARAASSRRGIGIRVVRDVAARTIAGWVRTYRSDLEADLADLRAPLGTLQAVLDGSVPAAPARSATDRALPRSPATPARAPAEPAVIAAVVPTEAPSEPAPLDAADLLRQAIQRRRRA